MRLRRLVQVHRPHKAGKKIYHDFGSRALLITIRIQSIYIYTLRNMNTNMISKFHTSFEIAGGVPVNTKSPVAKRRFMTTHVFLCILDRRVVRHSDEPSVVTYHSDLN